MNHTTGLSDAEFAVLDGTVLAETLAGESLAGAFTRGMVRVGSRDATRGNVNPNVPPGRAST